MVGCQSGGDFRDLALVKQSKRELRRIRNAIEEYKLDHNAYPPEGTDLKAALAPYLFKFTYTEGKNLAPYTSIVLSTRNNLDELNASLSGCARVKDSLVEQAFNNLLSSLKAYELLLSGEDIKIAPIEPDISKLQTLITRVNPMERKSSTGDSLIKTGTQIISMIKRLLPSAINEEPEHLNNIKSTFEWYDAELTGKKINQPTERFSPEAELLTLQELRNDSTAFLELQNLISSYRRLESSVAYYEFLTSLIKDIDRSQKILKMFNEKLREASKAAKIVQAQAILRRMADALRDYRRNEGKFPAPDTDIESILHPYFIETTMSGEQIDRWQASLKWLTGVPAYKTKDENMEFTLTTQVNNESKLHIFQDLSIQNQWDEIVSVFSEPLIYTTPDPSKTYFIKAKAKDTGKTLLTDRPPVIKTRS